MIFLFVHKSVVFVERSQRFACLSTKQALLWRFSGRREISLMWLATQKRGYMLRSRTSGTFRTCPPKGHFRGETSIDLSVCPQNRCFRGESSDDLPVCPQKCRFCGEISEICMFVHQTGAFVEKPQVVWLLDAEE